MPSNGYDDSQLKANGRASAPANPVRKGVRHCPHSRKRYAVPPPFASWDE